MNFLEEFLVSIVESVSRCTKNIESYFISGCFICGMCNYVFKVLFSINMRYY